MRLPGAQYVSIVSLFPSSAAGNQGTFDGFNGNTWGQWQASPDPNGVYWYRLEVKWPSPEGSDAGGQGVLSVEAPVQSPDQPRDAFSVWFFRGV